MTKLDISYTEYGLTLAGGKTYWRTTGIGEDTLAKVHLASKNLYSSGVSNRAQFTCVPVLDKLAVSRVELNKDENDGDRRGNTNYRWNIVVDRNRFLEDGGDPFVLMAGLLNEGAAIVKNQFKIPNAITKPESFTNELPVPSIGPDMEFLANQYDGSREDLNQYLAALVCGDVSPQIKCQPQSDFVALYKGNDKIAKLLVELYKVLPIEVRKLTTVATDLDSDFAWNSEGRLLALNSVNGESIQNLVKSFRNDSSVQARERIDLVQSQYIEKLYLGDGEKLVRSYQLPQLLSTMAVELDRKPKPVADTNQNTKPRNSVSVEKSVSKNRSDGKPSFYPRLGLLVSLVLGLFGGAVFSKIAGRDTRPPGNGIEVNCPEVTETPPSITPIESVDSQNEELLICRALNNDYSVRNESIHAELAEAINTIDNLESEKAEVEQLNKEKDAEIGRLNELNEEKEAEIGRLNGAKDAEIGRLNELNEEKEAEIVRLNEANATLVRSSTQLVEYKAAVITFRDKCGNFIRCTSLQITKDLFTALNYKFPVSKTR